VLKGNDHGLHAEAGGALATPAELQRLTATLQGFPTSEEGDRQLLQVPAWRKMQCREF
jgi:hypothetical protein